MNAGLAIVILILLVVANAALNAVEIAVIAANRLRVRHMAELGSRRAQALQRLQRDPESFFAAVVFMVNTTVVLSGAIGPIIYDELIGGTGALEFILSSLVVASITAILGDLTPKVLGARAADVVAPIAAPFVEGLTTVLTPFVATLRFLPSLISRTLLGVDLHAGPSVTEAELRMLIDIGAETGSVAEEEAELLDRVFHFGDRRVHEVMVPRTEVVWVPHGSTVHGFYEIFAAHPHSRFPVFEGSPDRVLGVVGIKDVLRGLSTGAMNDDSVVESVLRPAYFVPETKLAGELFREMQASRTQMAVAIDEYGGTAGIVTLEQLLEEMVGSVSDELRAAEEEIRPIDERTVQVDGSLSIEEAREELGIDIPEGDYDTIAGYVLSLLGHIPHEGESVAADDHRITVLEMRGQKIEVLRVTKA